MNKKDHVLNALLLGIGLGFVLHPTGDVQTLKAVAAVTIPVVLGALFPDVDTDFGKHRKTLHNLPVLALFYGFPFVFGNLAWVWVGVLTHYVLDIIGSKRGIALFYPLSSSEYGFPTGVTTSSKHSTSVTVLVTLLEIGAVAAVLYYVPHVIPQIPQGVTTSFGL